MLSGLRFRVWGVGCRVGLEAMSLRIWSLRCRVSSLGIKYGAMPLVAPSAPNVWVDLTTWTQSFR